MSTTTIFLTFRYSADFVDNFSFTKRELHIINPSRLHIHSFAKPFRHISPLLLVGTQIIVYEVTRFANHFHCVLSASQVPLIGTLRRTLLT